MKNTPIQILRKDFKAFGHREFCYDVYEDRVNFYGFSYGRIYYHFFTSVRGIMIDRDRSGYSISRKDAEKLGIPMERSQYVINCRDLRKRGYRL